MTEDPRNIPHTEKHPVGTRCSRRFSLRRGLIVTALFIFFAVSLLAFLRLMQAQSALAISLSSVQHTMKQQELSQQVLQSEWTKLKQTTEQALKNNTALAEKQASLIAEWQAARKGDFKRWQVAQARYLVRIANDHLELTHDYPLALLLLKRAQALLHTVQDQATDGIKTLIAQAITQLESASVIDIENLFVRLSRVDQAIDSLPLQPLINANPQKISIAPSEAVNGSGWQLGFKQLGELLSKIVVVRQAEMPLVLPEEKLFLYQNLHTQIHYAMWAVLHRKNEIYQTSLLQASDWIKHYFIADAQKTEALLRHLEALQQINITPSLINLKTSLAAFEAYFSAENIPQVQSSLSVVTNSEKA